MRGPVAAVGVVVPVHDEEEHLGAALTAVVAAARHPGLAGIPALVAVVLDGCTDRSARVVDAFAATSSCAPAGPAVLALQTDGANVGAARAAGAAAVLERLASLPPAVVWLATTDADSAVPPGWLARQVARRGEGIDAWAGTVRVADWRGRSASLVGLFRDEYRRVAATVGHVHGTSLGVAADAYLAAGGFPLWATGEDHGLWTRLGRIGARRVHDAACPVTTSGRRAARAPHGFAGYLDHLELSRALR
jgi:glycosyltransferase involved in cell wall biosynthesis